MSLFWNLETIYSFWSIYTPLEKEVSHLYTFREYNRPSNHDIFLYPPLPKQGTGDPVCRFRYHLVDGQLMRFESVHNPNRFISVFKKYGPSDDVKHLRRSGASSSMSMRSVDSSMSTESTSGRGQAGLFAVVLVVSTQIIMYLPFFLSMQKKTIGSL